MQLHVRVCRNDRLGGQSASASRLFLGGGVPMLALKAMLLLGVGEGNPTLWERTAVSGFPTGMSTALTLRCRQSYGVGNEGGKEQ
eukprot:360656-Chlamydomonas_euryale.AAC.2